MVMVLEKDHISPSSWILSSPPVAIQLSPWLAYIKLAEELSRLLAIHVIANSWRIAISNFIAWSIGGRKNNINETQDSRKLGTDCTRLRLHCKARGLQLFQITLMALGITWNHYWNQGISRRFLITNHNLYTYSWIYLVFFRILWIMWCKTLFGK